MSHKILLTMAIRESVKIPGFQPISGKQVAEVEKLQGHHVNDVALPLDVAMTFEQTRVPRSGAVSYQLT